MDRALSFGSVADDYDRLRPTPPAEAIEWLLPDLRHSAVDLGAGTGKMTRALVSRFDSVIAVEPDDRMLAVLSRQSPQVTALIGTSDGIPVEDATADLVVVSSAWHWMDPATAVPEIARVLRDGGRFAVIWNGRDTSTGVMLELIDAVIPAEVARPEEIARRSRALELPAGSPFTEPEMARFRYTMPMTPDEVAESFGTYSAVIALGDEGRQATIAKAREHLREHYAGQHVLQVPFKSRAFRCDRLAR